MYAWIYVYHVCMHACIVCVYTCVHASMCICMYVYMYACVHTCMYNICNFQVGFWAVRGGIVLVGRGNCPGELSGGEVSGGNCPGGKCPGPLYWWCPEWVDLYEEIPLVYMQEMSFQNITPQRPLSWAHLGVQVQHPHKWIRPCDKISKMHNDIPKSMAHPSTPKFKTPKFLVLVWSWSLETFCFFKRYQWCPISTAQLRVTCANTGTDSELTFCRRFQAYIIIVIIEILTAKCLESNWVGSTAII